MTRPEATHIATLLFADLVDSTALAGQVGEAVSRDYWARHDRLARDLIASCHGVEVGRSDGFFVYFAQASCALDFALGYHELLAALRPEIAARIGADIGPVRLRANSSADRERGATPFEVDSLVLAVAARAMAAAGAGQTLITAKLVTAALPHGSDATCEVYSHGHWRLKGIDEPIELFEAAAPAALRAPPPDSAKAYRVLLRDGLWLPVRELPHNLPRPGNAFFGREADLRTLARLFDGGARLVTLLGMGGIGKTRLALRHAMAWRGEYPGGAWLCDLSAARTPDGVLHSVAQGLDVPLGHADPLRQLGAALAGRGECLVILDNFEQVARHAEATLGVWLVEAPQARFIVTSRELLGLRDEQVLVLAPLAADEAAGLFRDRAREAGVDTGLDDDTALNSLVELLDRLPLAIELAASRARVMPPATQLQHIGERFKLLARVGGRRDRQATLRATLDWSWELLPNTERAALARLTVFEQGFTLKAAAAVIEGADGSAAWAPDLLQSLNEKSLVRRVAGDRFDLLRTVQDYAAERLVGADAQEAQRRHWMHFAGLDEHAAVAGRCMEAENLVAACARATPSDPQAAAALLLNTWAALRLTGPFNVAVDLAQQLSEGCLPEASEQVACARVRGAALTLLGQADEARLHLEQGLRLAQRGRLVSAGAQLSCLLAALDIAAGRGEVASARLEVALDQARATRDTLGELMALNELGSLAFSQSNLVQAQARFDEALAIAERAGERRWQGGLLGNLGSVAITAGRLMQARSFLERSLEVAAELGDRPREGNARCNLGLLLHELGASREAHGMLEAAVGIAQRIGHRRLEAMAACNLGLVLEALGDMSGAEAQHRAAVVAASAAKDARLAAQLQGHLGLLLARLGQQSAAQASFEFALSVYSDGTDPAALALLHCQQAQALMAVGQHEEASVSLSAAEALVCDEPPAEESELGRALSRTRQDCAVSAADKLGRDS